MEKHSQFEYGGAIFTFQGRYGYSILTGGPGSTPVYASDPTMKAMNLEVVAYWHTHPRCEPCEEFSPWNPERHSGDLAPYPILKLPVYLNTFGGRNLHYDPKTEKQRAVR